MTTAQAILLVAVLVLTDGLILFVGVPLMVRGVWEPLARAFPPCEPAPSAVRRDFQSFRFDLINLGWSLHAAADEQFLHLQPTWFARRFGITPISVPWDRIRIVRRKKTATLAKIGPSDVWGPAWCLNLAEPTRAPLPAADR